MEQILIRYACPQCGNRNFYAYTTHRNFDSDANEWHKVGRHEVTGCTRACERVFKCANGHDFPEATLKEEKS